MTAVRADGSSCDEDATVHFDITKKGNNSIEAAWEKMKVL